MILTCSSLVGFPEFQEQARHRPCGFSWFVSLPRTSVLQLWSKVWRLLEGLVETPPQAPPRQAESELIFAGSPGPYLPLTVTLS